MALCNNRGLFLPTQSEQQKLKQSNDKVWWQ